jgi:hypothetical protein
MTNTTMAERKGTKWQNVVNIILHRKLFSNTYLTKGGELVFSKRMIIVWSSSGTVVLLLLRIRRKGIKEERMTGLWVRQADYIHGQLWHKYSITMSHIWYNMALRRTYARKCFRCIHDDYKITKMRKEIIFVPFERWVVYLNRYAQPGNALRCGSPHMLLQWCIPLVSHVR